MDMIACSGCGQLIYQDAPACPHCKRTRSARERDWDDAAKRVYERKRDALPGKLLRAAMLLGLLYACYLQRAFLHGQALIARAAFFAELDRIQQGGKPVPAAAEAAPAPAAAPAAPAAPEALPPVEGEVMDVRVTPPAPAPAKAR